MEEKNEEVKSEKCKSNKVFVIVIVVIAMVLTFGCGMILGHKLGDSKKDKSKENEVIEKKYIVEFKEYNSGDYPYDNFRIVVYDKTVYVIESYENMGKAIELIKNENDSLIFNNNKYEDEESDIEIRKIDLDSDNIVDVFVTFDPFPSDAVPMALIILKDGKVKKYSVDWNNLDYVMTLKDATEFESYSVKKIKSYECSKYVDNGFNGECRKSKSEFLTNDGTNQTIEFKVEIE